MGNVDLMADAGPVHDYRDNPFGLVYEYPIIENEAGKVNIHPVAYSLRGLKIAANVYTPAGYDPDGSYPAITVAHANGGTKEQTAGRYAQRLAEHGYITIAADAAYQGHSEGEPRSVDKPFFRTDDIHGMADFLATFPGVDADRIGALGICGGGGYTLDAVKSDKRFKAVATISMFSSGSVRRNGLQNSALDAIQDELRQASTWVLWGIISQPYVNGVQANQLPDGQEGIGLAFAGLHNINQIWCDDGTCGHLPPTSRSTRRPRRPT